MQRFAALLIALALLLPGVALGATQNKRINVIENATTVAQGTTKEVRIDNSRHSTGYLVVKTTNEQGASSLTVTVKADTPLVDFDLCTMTAITTETTTVALVGHAAAAGEGLTDVCDFPMTKDLLIEFDVTAGTSFDVQAYFEMTADF